MLWSQKRKSLVIYEGLENGIGTWVNPRNILEFLFNFVWAPATWLLWQRYNNNNVICAKGQHSCKENHREHFKKQNKDGENNFVNVFKVPTPKIVLCKWWWSQLEENLLKYTRGLKLFQFIFNFLIPGKSQWLYNNNNVVCAKGQHSGKENHGEHFKKWVWQINKISW